MVLNILFKKIRTKLQYTIFSTTYYYTRFFFFEHTFCIQKTKSNITRKKQGLFKNGIEDMRFQSFYKQVRYVIFIFFT